MQETKIEKKIDNYCNELEVLSSKMVDFFSIGNYNKIKSIDLKRKIILEEISKDLGNLSNSNKKKLEVVWINNNKLIKNFQNEMEKNKRVLIDKKKLFIAYSNNSSN